MIHHDFDHRMYVRERSVIQPQGTLLYVHGLGESGLCLEPLITAHPLRGWHHLVPDLPGYGKSPWRDEPLSLAAHAERLAAWADDRRRGPLVVVGHSMGGVVGTMLCERLPPAAELRGFLNVEGNLSLGDCGYSSQAAGQSQEEFLAAGYQRLLDGIYAGGVDDPALRTYFASACICDPRAYYRNGCELVALSAAETLAARLAALEVPVLYLLGHPRGTGERSRRLLSAAGVPWRMIGDAGHWPFIDQPTAFVAAMVSFLDRLVAG